MKINIKATNIELTESLREHLENKMDYLRRYVDTHDPEAIVRVEIGKLSRHHKHGNVFMAEITVHVVGNDLRAVAEDNDLYAAIDLAKDEMIREIKSVRGKKTALSRRGGRAIKKLTREA